MASLEMNRRVRHAAAPILRLRSETRAWLAFGLLLVLAAGFLWYETRGTTLWFDDWNYALYRRGGGLATYLKPQNQHFSLIPIAIYKFLFATVGIGDYRPYRLIVIAGHLTCSLLLFVYALRRVGSYLAFLIGGLFLLFGPAWQTSIWPIQIAWIVPLTAGIAAFLMLDRGDRLGNGAACVLTGVALASSGIGLPVALGVLADTLIRSDRRRRWWVAIVPLALYAIWWLAYQTSDFNRHNIVLMPAFVAKAAAGAVAYLVGLGGDAVFPNPDTPLVWGVPLLLIGIAAAVWRLRPLGLPSPRLVSLLVMAFSFWVLQGLTRATLALGFESRYLYVSGVFLLLIAIEVLRGVAVPQGIKIVLGVLVAGAVLSNLGAFREGARFLRDQGQQTKAALEVLDLSRPVVAPSYVTHGLPGYPLVTVRAGAYFSAEDAYGTPAASEATLMADPEYIREAADGDLIRIHRVGLVPAATAAGSTAAAPRPEAVAGGSVTPQGSCMVFRPASFGSPSNPPRVEFTLPPAGLVIRTGAGPADISVRRLADQYAADPLIRLRPSSAAILRIRRDRSARTWHVRVEPEAQVSVCGFG